MGTFHHLAPGTSKEVPATSLKTATVPGNFFELVPGAGKAEKQGTAAIVRAVRRGDAEGAAAEYATMLRKQGDLVVDLFQHKNLFEGESSA